MPEGMRASEGFMQTGTSNLRCLPQAADQLAHQLEDAQENLHMVEGDLQDKVNECTSLLSENLNLKVTAPGYCLLRWICCKHPCAFWPTRIAWTRRSTS